MTMIESSACKQRFTLYTSMMLRSFFSCLLLAALAAAASGASTATEPITVSPSSLEHGRMLPSIFSGTVSSPKPLVRGRKLPSVFSGPVSSIVTDSKLLGRTWTDIQDAEGSEEVVGQQAVGGDGRKLLKEKFEGTVVVEAGVPVTETIGAKAGGQGGGVGSEHNTDYIYHSANRKLLSLKLGRSAVVSGAVAVPAQVAVTGVVESVIAPPPPPPP